MHLIGRRLELCETIPGYNEDDSPALLYTVHDVSTNGSAGDPVPLVDDQPEAMLLLQVEPPASPLLVPHENVRHPPSVLVAEKKNFERKYELSFLDVYIWVFPQDTK